MASVVDYPTKAETFNNYFVSQCTPLDAGDEVPHLPSRPPGLLSITFSQEKILNIIRALDSNKSSGWDGVSPCMIKICDSSIVNPLLIIFETCIREGIFPDIVGLLIKGRISSFCYFEIIALLSRW